MSKFEKIKALMQPYLKIVPKHIFESIDENKKIEEVDITETDKNKVWAFCAGHYSNDFRGNPKYLFLYMNEYRKDITTYWLCENDDVLELVRSMGYRAYKLHSLQAEQAINLTGVLVAEQVKSYIPEGLEHAKYLNLWHGVGGVKAVEKSLLEGSLLPELAKKYIQRNEYFSKYELYLATSPFIEEIAKEQLGISADRMIRAGYPRNIYQKQYKRIETFDHDLIKAKGLPEDTKIVVYAPTHRNNQERELFASAILDIDRLIEVCQKKHILFVFKMHPLSEHEQGFLSAKESYKDCSWLYFWDNQNDFYEVMDKVDLCIMDFSSIFTDMLSAGVKHFIRYMFDIDQENMDFPMEYDEITLGQKCKSYEELLAALEKFEQEDLTEDIIRINQLYWRYSDENDMERIIETTLAYQPKEQKLPILYSFDIFDTLISRKVLDPMGIFYRVREKMREENFDVPFDLIDNYTKIRWSCEKNCRTYYNRSKIERNDERCEIQFAEIFEYMRKIYPLTDAQINQLMQWEMEIEYEDSIPLKEQIDLLKELVAKGETVVLISDMYLPRDFIEKLLRKADPILAQIPLFLSSEYGYQKSAKTLYLEVYKYFAPYNFGKWIHRGDNEHSDIKMARSLGITAIKIDVPKFDQLEKEMCEKIGTYDAFLIAAKLARFRQEHPNEREQFVYSYVSLLFVPYIYWCIHDAIQRGDKVLYFISRDGHHLKRIADAIIKCEGLDIETKYIYASRRAWRIPSFIDHIDVGFWGQGYGNFARVDKFSKLLKAMNMTEETFRKMFPEFSYMDTDTTFTLPELKKIVEILKKSSKFHKYILETAEKERVSVCGYLKQEMDQEKQFSIVEYWGRGYTQENFTRLWHQVIGKEVPTVFYYSRSTLPSEGYNIRKNFTLNPTEQQFIEAIFANMPYKSIEKYNMIDGKWIPEIQPLECDSVFFEAMEKYLVRFAEDYCELQTKNREILGRSLIDFAITFRMDMPQWSLFLNVMASLKDSVELYGQKLEYAKEFTMKDLEDIQNKVVARQKLTKSLTMSLTQSTEFVQKEYNKMFQIRQGEPFVGGIFLSKGEVKKDQKYILKKENYEQFMGEIRHMYKVMSDTTDVENKILIIKRKKEDKAFGIRKISALLDNQDTYEVKELFLDECVEKKEDFVKELITARFIITEKVRNYLANISFRPETCTIVLGDLPIFFQNMGLAKTYKIRGEDEFERMQQMMKISEIMLPSEAMLPIYQKVYNVASGTKFSIKGNCMTDLLLDPVFAKTSREKLEKYFGAAKGKKVICYIPAYRLRKKRCSFGEVLDMKMMQKALGQEYIVIMHNQPDTREKLSNSLEVDGFCCDLTSKMTAREQFAAADIIVGDYRNVVFEVPVMKKPLYLTDWDAVAGRYDRNQLFDYSDFATAGVEVKDTQDLIAKIKCVDTYDYSITEQYVQKYLTYCDGHSADRLYTYLMENSLDKSK